MHRKLLIIDDSVINRAVLSNILRDEYDVIESADPTQGVSILSLDVDSIVCVVISSAIPFVDLNEVLASLKKAKPRVPVILLTGDSVTGTAVKALTNGADDYIVKPFNPDVIKRRISTVVRRAGSTVPENEQTDALTGLYSREAFFSRCGKLIAMHDPGYYIMACFDVDAFKVINDRYGIEKGDSVLRMIAGIFRRGFEPIGGLCCRIMADNFAVLYPRRYTDGDLIEEIRRSASELDSSIMPITFSIGRYVINDLSLSPSVTYERASLAQAYAKGNGDEKIVYYDESMRLRLLREHEITGEMHTALAHNDFEVWFQPQYNHTSGALVGAEALVRWRNPRHGIISPEEFIPVFEKNGFVYELDKYMWEQVCRYIRKWLDEGRSPLPVSVNVSRYDIFREDMIDVITGLVNKYDIPVDLLRIEITESAFAQFTQQVITVVNRLIDFGFIIEIDDFGSGYSSLNILKDVPANVLKLDMRFLEGDKNSEKSGNIVEAIVRMARRLGMSVIAEGVETREQANFLKSIGCYCIQGFLYAKPMTAQRYELLSSIVDSNENEKTHAQPDTVFWDPNSLDTLIFNTYIGAACVYEYRDGDMDLLRINDKYATCLLGDRFGFETAMSLNIFDYMDGADRRRIFDSIDKASGTDDETAVEVKLTGLPGREKDIFLNVTQRVISHSCESVIIYASVEDITGRRETENARIQALALLNTVVEGIKIAVCAVAFNAGGETRIIYANDRYYEMLGYTRDEFNSLGISAIDTVLREDREKMYKTMIDSSYTRDSVICEYNALCKNGEVIKVLAKVTVTDIDGVDEPVHIVVITDVEPIGEV